MNPTDIPVFPWMNKEGFLHKCLITYVIIIWEAEITTYLLLDAVEGVDVGPPSQESFPQDNEDHHGHVWEDEEGCVQRKQDEVDELRTSEINTGQRHKCAISSQTEQTRIYLEDGQHPDPVNLDDAHRGAGDEDAELVEDLPPPILLHA